MVSASRRSVFISYARADGERVRPHVELLKAGGVKVFVDVVSIDYGERWKDALEKALKHCERVMVFWSAAAAVSEWVRREWQTALGLGKRIVPTLLDDTPLDEELAAFQALPLQARREPHEPSIHEVPPPPAPTPSFALVRRGRHWVGAGLIVSLFGLSALLVTTRTSKNAPVETQIVEEIRVPPAVAVSPSPSPLPEPSVANGPSEGRNTPECAAYISCLGFSERAATAASGADGQPTPSPLCGRLSEECRHSLIVGLDDPRPASHTDNQPSIAWLLAPLLIIALYALSFAPDLRDRLKRRRWLRMRGEAFADQVFST